MHTYCTKNSIVQWRNPCCGSFTFIKYRQKLYIINRNSVGKSSCEYSGEKCGTANQPRPLTIHSPHFHFSLSKTAIFGRKIWFGNFGVFQENFYRPKTIQISVIVNFSLSNRWISFFLLDCTYVLNKATSSYGYFDIRWQCVCYAGKLSILRRSQMTLPLKASRI